MTKSFETCEDRAPPTMSRACEDETRPAQTRRRAACEKDEEDPVIRDSRSELGKTSLAHHLLLYEPQHGYGVVIRRLIALVAHYFALETLDHLKPGISANLCVARIK